MIRKSISIYLKNEDKKIIEEGSKLSGLNQSSFCRNSAIIHARKIIQENERRENARSN